MNALHAISPLDGRYKHKLQNVSELASEAALIHYRLRVEAHWLSFLATKEPIHKGTLMLSLPANTQKPITAFLQNIQKGSIPIGAAERIKALESTTKHDVKAVEYYLAEELRKLQAPEHFLAFIHFAATSEDINNLAYGLMLKEIRELVILPNLHTLITTLRSLAHNYAAAAMIARTHGQTASPTTMGKEIAVFAARLKRQVQLLKNVPVLGKMAGATGNYNAHHLAYPDIPWQNWAQEFVNSLSLTHNPVVTQVESHDGISEYLDTLRRINSICLDMCRDMWGYISLGYFQQNVQKDEVGSSTMPHKVNPIDFENAEGNFGVSSALCTHLSKKLLISRWQRDLSDSTVLRSLGSCVGYHSLGIEALKAGFAKITLNTSLMQKELQSATEVLAEAVQTIMRKHGIGNAYEKVKERTRGQQLTAAKMQELCTEFADELPDDAHKDKQRLLSLNPQTYLGLAEDIALSV